LFGSLRAAETAPALAANSDTSSPKNQTRKTPESEPNKSSTVENVVIFTTVEKIKTALNTVWTEDEDSPLPRRLQF
jgi:hypothetical protein